MWDEIEENKKQTEKVVKSPSGSIHEDGAEWNSYSSSSSYEKEPHRRSSGGRRPAINFNDFKVEIPTFERELNPDEFI